MTEFETKVAKVVKAIPRGQTFSYARVALFANKPGAARAVVRALRVAKSPTLGLDCRPAPSRETACDREASQGTRALIPGPCRDRQHP